MNNEDAISRAYALGIIQHIQDDKAQTAPEKNILNFAFVGIKCAPSVPPQVVHGRWVILTHDEQSDCDIYGCENCKVPTGIVKPIWRFCPNCGALMGGEDDAAR